MLFDVRFDRNEILLNELRGLRVVVRLGFQPSAGASSRRRTKVDKKRLMFFFSQKQCLIDVAVPIDAHMSSNGGLSPPSEGGAVAPHNQLPRYRNRGATGVVNPLTTPAAPKLR